MSFLSFCSLCSVTKRVLLIEIKQIQFVIKLFYMKRLFDVFLFICFFGFCLRLQNTRLPLIIEK